MIIKRKLFASSPQQYLPPGQQSQQPKDPGILQQESFQQQVSSKDLQIEQMRLQRQLLETQKMRQRIQAEERMQEMKAQQAAQKIEQQKDEQQKENQIKVRKMENQREANNETNLPLYKTKSKPVKPVSMKMNQ